MACRGSQTALIRFLGGVALGGAGVTKSYQDHVLRTLTARESTARDVRAAQAQQQVAISVATIDRATSDLSRATRHTEVTSAISSSRRALDQARRAGADRKELLALEREVEKLRRKADEKAGELNQAEQFVHRREIDPLARMSLGIAKAPARASAPAPPNDPKLPPARQPPVRDERVTQAQDRLRALRKDVADASTTDDFRKILQAAHRATSKLLSADDVSYRDAQSLRDLVRTVSDEVAHRKLELAPTEFERKMRAAEILGLDMGLLSAEAFGSDEITAEQRNRLGHLNAALGALGEATAEKHFAANGWIPIQAVDAHAHGIDLVHFDPDSRELLVVEVKTSATKSSFTAAMLDDTEHGRQMSEKWLGHAFTAQGYEDLPEKLQMRVAFVDTTHRQLILYALDGSGKWREQERVAVDFDAP